jgi:hypothetical protein
MQTQFNEKIMHLSTNNARSHRHPHASHIKTKSKWMIDLNIKADYETLRRKY